MRQRYNSELDLGQIQITTMEQPDGTENISSQYIEQMFIAILLSYLIYLITF